MRRALVLVLLLAACGGAGRRGGALGADACRSDADCAPATCCHPTGCVPRVAAPDCRAVACTRECRPGTLDCGGACVCREGRCGARLAGAPPGADTIPLR